MRQAPGENLMMLELMYLCLSLGFEGRYRRANRGRDALEQIKDELFRLIRQYRGEHERSLSSNWQGLGKARGSLSEHIPLWVLACIVAGGVLLTYTGFNYWLYTNSTPVVERLEEVTRSIHASRGLYRVRRSSNRRDQARVDKPLVGKLVVGKTIGRPSLKGTQFQDKV